MSAQVLAEVLSKDCRSHECSAEGQCGRLAMCTLALWEKREYDMNLIDEAQSSPSLARSPTRPPDTTCSAASGIWLYRTKNVEQRKERMS